MCRRVRGPRSFHWEKTYRTRDPPPWEERLFCEAVKALRKEDFSSKGRQEHSSHQSCQECDSNNTSVTVVFRG